jgi:7-cyano-7-deazaguanine synthase
MSKAVVLLSGGLDSTVCISIAIKEGLDIFPLSFDYGQRHSKELECAKNVSDFYGVKSHRVISIGNTGGSALTDLNIKVPEYEIRNSIPVTYVPARNIIFLSYAVGYAETIGADFIFIGVNALDYSGYPDCRPEFIEAFQKMIKVGTKSGAEGKSVQINAPLQLMTKAQIVSEGLKNGAPLHLTTSCYRGGKNACGVCDSCVLRLKGFKEAGFVDLIEYDI